jgi:uncharacterized protein YajQ (UPF0234 family)
MNVAKDCSLDVVSDIDMQEVDNFIQQTIKEISQRFDFRGSKSTVTLEKDTIKVLADDDMKLKNIIDILQAKAIKRNVSIKTFEYGKVEPAAHGCVRQVITLKKGIDKDKAKVVLAAIKTSKLKVQAQIMDDQIRVSGKNKDDLQNVMTLLKQQDFDIDLQFVNFRS